MAPISIAEALRDLKLLDSRIQRGIASTNVVAAVQQMTDRIGGLSKAEFDRASNAAWDSYNGLTTRRALLKQKIVESNAATVVTLAGETMTVAAAIERRKHSIGYKRAMLKQLNTQWDATSKQITAANTKLRSDLEKQYAEMAKENPDAHAQMIAVAFERNSLKLVDPLGLAAVIAKLTEEIEAFDGNFDLVINASNYATTIDV